MGQNFKPYTGQFIPVSIPLNTVPAEGTRMVKVVIDFSQSPYTTINMQNTQGSTTQTLSLIRSVYVDNSQNGNDVIVMFDNDGFTLEVSAYAQGLFPVFTNQVVFNVRPRVDQVATNGTTRLYVMNFFMAGFSASEFQEVIVSGVGSGGLVENFRIGDNNLVGFVQYNAPFPIVAVAAPFYMTSVEIVFTGLAGTAPGIAFFEVRDGTDPIYVTSAVYTNGALFPGFSTGKDLYFTSSNSQLILSLTTSGGTLNSGGFSVNISYGLQ